MTLQTLQIIWFALIAVLFAVYLMLDGFDLGVGFWHLLTRGDDERRSSLGAIGPFWDGNEVWLLTGAGAVFAAFPDVYATVFSGLYLALMLVLFALILRAVAIEFRGKGETAKWRSGWDRVFAVSSIVVALLLGVAAGNLARGLPLDANMDYTGTFLSLLNPYALLAGVTTLVVLACHGAIYLSLKADGSLADKAKRWAGRSSWVCLALVLVLMAMTAAAQGHLRGNYLAHPILLLVPVCQLLAVVLMCVSLRSGRAGRAFAFSAASIVLLVAVFAVGLYPHLVYAPNDPALSLAATNASSSQRTLGIMLTMTCIGLPLVIGYTIWTYRVFGTRIEPGQQGY